jgi:hypothetical protein
LTIVSAAKLGVPFLHVKGNHDITGPGAVQAYDEVLRPFNRHEAVELTDGACYVLRHHGVMFCCFDAYEPASLDWLERVLATRTAADRVVFFVIHPPVVPYSARCWHVYNRPEQAQRRNRLLHLLARHSSIVLNGHLHRFGLLDRRVEEKSIRQFSVISVLPDTKPNVRDETSKYGPSMTDLEPNFSPETLEARKQTLAAEAPFVTDYAYANAPGYAMVHVRPDSITADLYIGLARTIWKTIRLA